MEQDIRGLKTKQNKSQNHPRFDDELHGPVQRRDEARATSMALAEREVEVNSNELHDVFESENAADGMGAIGFSAEEDCGFFGNACW